MLEMLVLQPSLSVLNFLTAPPDSSGADGRYSLHLVDLRQEHTTHYPVMKSADETLNQSSQRDGEASDNYIPAVAGFTAHGALTMLCYVKEHDTPTMLSPGPSECFASREMIETLRNEAL